MKYLAASMLAVLLAGSAAVWAVPLPQDTNPAWTVTFRFKHPVTGPAPKAEIRIYVSVRALQEGEAAILAHEALAEKLAMDSIKELMYLEAQKREDGK